MEKPSKHTIDEAARNGEVTALSDLLNVHTPQEQLSEWYQYTGYRSGNSMEDNARNVIRYAHCFDSWEDYEAFQKEFNSDKLTAAFELAADAIPEGDIKTLENLLADHPDLISMRSKRNHHSTLLNYVGANGFEAWRQKTPANSADVAKLLLDAGAEIDAWGDMYGGTSTLGLVATSVHPVITGVQEELMEVLIQHGADLNHAVAPDYTDGILILACIHNGRYEPIHYLARHGAQVDLEAACALGDLGKVQELFNQASVAKRNIGLAWACEFGHKAIALYLLDKGVPLNVYTNGTTPLLAAAFGGQMDIVEWLIRQGANIEATNDYGGTALGQTLWCLYNHCKPQHPDIMELLISKGAVIKDNWQQFIDEQRNKHK